MEVLESLLQLVAAGGSQALIGILFAAIIYLLWERIKLFAIIKEYRKLVDENRNQYSESIVQIIERYHAGNLELVQALNEIKVVLSTMQKTIMM